MSTLTDFLGISQSDEGKKHQQNFGQIADMIKQYQAHDQAARQAAINQTIQSYNPLDEVLKEIYGSQSGLNLKPFNVSPYNTPEALTALEKVKQEQSQQKDQATKAMDNISTKFGLNGGK